MTTRLLPLLLAALLLPTSARALPADAPTRADEPASAQAPAVPGDAELLSAAAQPHADVLRFAEQLLQDGDHYRAIGEFKRFVFLAPAAPEAFHAQLAIGRAYELGGKPGDAAVWLKRLAPLAPSESLRADVLVELAYARYLAGSSLNAADDLDGLLRNPKLVAAAQAATLERARYLLAWAQLIGHRPAQAAATFRTVNLAWTPELANQAEKALDLPSKSAVLAGILNALLPGLGHVYLGQPFIGLAAFAWNALFIVATVDAFRNKQWGTGAVLGGLELLWYGGAIFGAISGAEKYNRDAELNHIDELKRRYDPAPLSWPPQAPGR